MAEPNIPAGETPTGRRAADEPELLSPPTDEELAATGEPTLEEVRAAAGDDGDVRRSAEGVSETTRPAEEAARPAATAARPAATAARPAETPDRSSEPAARPAATAAHPVETETETERIDLAKTPSGDDSGRTSAVPTAAAQPAAAPPAAATPAAPAEPQPVLAPADDDAPPPPRTRSNRLVGTAWVLLAAGLFQVVFFGINALVAFTFGGPDAAVPQVQQIAGTPLAWLPVLLFFLLYELTVLLLNRAGRVVYVLASGIVGIVVYIASTLLFSLIERHALGDSNTLAQTFLNWEFILIGLTAREVMLWTGLAVGSRGIRLRRRNEEDRARYDEGRADD